MVSVLVKMILLFMGRLAQTHEFRLDADLVMANSMEDSSYAVQSTTDVLWPYSAYIRGGREFYSESQRDQDVAVPEDISPPILRRLLSLFQQGVCAVERSDLAPMLHAMEQLLIQDAIVVSFLTWIYQTYTLSTWLELSAIGMDHFPTIGARIGDNVDAKVMEMRTDVLALNYDEFAALIRRPSLWIPNEAFLDGIVDAWIERDESTRMQHMTTLYSFSDEDRERTNLWDPETLMIHSTAPTEMENLVLQAYDEAQDRILSFSIPSYWYGGAQVYCFCGRQLHHFQSSYHGRQRTLVHVYDFRMLQWQLVFEQDQVGIAERTARLLATCVDDTNVVLWKVSIFGELSATEWNVQNRAFQPSAITPPAILGWALGLVHKDRAFFVWTTLGFYRGNERFELGPLIPHLSMYQRHWKQTQVIFQDENVYFVNFVYFNRRVYRYSFATQQWSMLSSGQVFPSRTRWFVSRAALISDTGVHLALSAFVPYTFLPEEPLQPQHTNNNNPLLVPNL